MKLSKILMLLIAVILSGCSYSSNAPGRFVFTESTVPSTAASQTEAPPATETVPSQAPVQPEPEDDDFVAVKNYMPEITVELRYATEQNFTGQRIYGFDELWLRYGTVKKLILVQTELAQMGLFLKIWDGFRPIAAQFSLWEICPDPTYVSDPNKGFSSHSRGNTVDVTLVDEDGKELVMPTDFDDFSKLADRDYSDCSAEAAANGRLLEQTMEKHGFKPYSGEWWHFSDMEAYPVEEEFLPVEAALYYADCEEFISLRTRPDNSAAVIVRIPAAATFTLQANCGDFSLVVYEGVYGYVRSSYIQPADE